MTYSHLTFAFTHIQSGDTTSTSLPLSSSSSSSTVNDIFLAERLRLLGYKTIAIGEWHLPLVVDQKENMPSYQGFQVQHRYIISTYVVLIYQMITCSILSCIILALSLALEFA
jgi:hypothetical protein